MTLQELMNEFVKVGATHGILRRDGRSSVVMDLYFGDKLVSVPVHYECWRPDCPELFGCKHCLAELTAEDQLVDTERVEAEISLFVTKPKEGL